MEELARILKQNDIDTTSLELLDEGFKDEIYCLTMAGPDTFSKWLKLRNLVDQTGFWPVVVPEWEPPASMIDFAEGYDDRSTDEFLAASGEVNAVEWLAESYKYQKDETDPNWQYPRGEWPTNVQPNNDLQIQGNDLQVYKGLEPLINYFVLVPTKFGWEVPAYLRFGYVRGLTKIQESVSVFKYWYELYGAEIYYIQEEGIWAYVTRPPQTKEAALKLAEEHYAYAPDNMSVSVKTGTIEGLAAELLNGQAWYFWWD